MLYRFFSWNVNGIRAIEKKGFRDWFFRQQPDILAVQETKASPEQVSDFLRQPPGYHGYWVSAERKGYSGVAVFSRKKPVSVISGLGNPLYDREGRTLILEYPSFVFAAVYFPNGKLSPERLRYKMGFYQEFFELYKRYSRTDKKKVFILCGDLNTAHQEIDLARPRENSNLSGFLPEERIWIDRFIDAGLADTFRFLHPQIAEYTWWDLKSAARRRNVGWRIDYFFISRTFLSRVEDAFIAADVYGSDHCPVGMTVRL